MSLELFLALPGRPLEVIVVHPAEARAGVEKGGHADSTWSCVKGLQTGRSAYPQVYTREKTERLLPAPRRRPCRDHSTATTAGPTRGVEPRSDCGSVTL